MIGLIRAVTVGTAGVALVYGAGHLAVDLDFSRPFRATVPAAQTVALARTQVVCPGPESLGTSVLAGSAAGRSAAAVPTVAVTAGTPPAQSLPRTVDAGADGFVRASLVPSAGSATRLVTVDKRPVAVATTRKDGHAVLLTGSGSLAPGLVAVQQSRSTSGPSRSLTSVACGPATSESWLVAGGAEAGRRELLVLTNPSANAVTVDVAVLGAAGPVLSPAGSGLVVRGGGRVILPVDGLAGREKSPVVHVVARGGTVAAVLNDTWLDGLVARGSDDAVGLVAPATEQILPAVDLAGSGVVRVATPGADEAVVQVRVLTTRGPQAVPGVGVVRVPGKSVREISLATLPAGAYAVQVRADRPVVAGARMDRREGAKPSDFAWTSAAPGIDGLAGSPLPALAGASYAVHLVATGEDALVGVTTVAKDGKATTTTVRVPGDSVSVIRAQAGGSVWVSPAAGEESPVRAGIVTTIGSGAGALVSATPLRRLQLTTVRPGLVEQP